MAETHFIMMIERWERARKASAPVSGRDVGFGSAIARARVEMAERVCEDLRVFVRLLHEEDNPLARLVVSPGEGLGEFKNESEDEHLLLTDGQAAQLERLKREAKLAEARKLVAEADAEAEAERIKREQMAR